MRPEIINIISKYHNGEFFDYIQNNILPQYGDSDGHGQQHINDVINRAFDLDQNLGLDLDFMMIAAGVFYHDLGRMIDDETHEIISAQTFMDDEKMQKFFDGEQRDIIAGAIEDHRASMKGEPKNIYGKLISSADRNTDPMQALARSYEYGTTRSPDASLEERIKNSFDHLNDKFGRDGYADTVYFDDGAYQKYLDDLRRLLDNYDLFRTEYLRINRL